MCSFNKWQAFIASLTIKYVTLHKIGISNWIPSTHVSTISTSLGHFIYLIGTGVRVNVGEFFFNHLLRHVDTFAIHILIYFPRLLSNFLVSQHPSILAPVNFVGSAPKVIYLSMRLFQVLHVSNVPIDFDTPSGFQRSIYCQPYYRKISRSVHVFGKSSVVSSSRGVSLSDASNKITL